MSIFYIVNEQNVASKILDQEAIAINLMSGDYFSFSGCASAIWKSLIGGADIEHMLAVVEIEFEDIPADVAQQIADYLDQLIAEQLIIAMPGGGAPRPIEPNALPRRRYEAPGIDKFDDMAAMLALDPPMPELPAHVADRLPGQKA
jgi:hypothetical protein